MTTNRNMRENENADTDMIPAEGAGAATERSSHIAG